MSWSDRKSVLLEIENEARRLLKEHKPLLEPYDIGRLTEIEKRASDLFWDSDAAIDEISLMWMVIQTLNHNIRRFLETQ